MNIVTRAEWGARPPKATFPIAKFQPTLILHHTAGAVLPGDDKVSYADLVRIKSVQNYHMDVRGWNDIAYNYMMDPDGFPLEGRGPGVANGATFGYGSKSYAICVMGHFDVQKPDDDLIYGLAGLVRWGHDEGLWPLGFSGGHRDFGDTSCPGNFLYPLIPTINQLAEEGTMTPEEVGAIVEEKLFKWFGSPVTINDEIDGIQRPTNQGIINGVHHPLIHGEKPRELLHQAAKNGEGVSVAEVKAIVADTKLTPAT